MPRRSSAPVVPILLGGRKRASLGSFAKVGGSPVSDRRGGERRGTLTVYNVQGEEHLEQLEEPSTPPARPCYSPACRQRQASHKPWGKPASHVCCSSACRKRGPLVTQSYWRHPKLKQLLTRARMCLALDALQSLVSAALARRILAAAAAAAAAAAVPVASLPPAVLGAPPRSWCASSLTRASPPRALARWSLSLKCWRKRCPCRSVLCAARALGSHRRSALPVTRRCAAATRRRARLRAKRRPPRLPAPAGAAGALPQQGRTFSES